MQAEHRERMHHQRDLRTQMEQIEKLPATPLETVLEVYTYTMFSCINTTLATIASSAHKLEVVPSISA
jgi:hypothetical protein